MYSNLYHLNSGCPVAGWPSKQKSDVVVQTPVSTTAPRSKLLDTSDRSCSELTKCKTQSRKGRWTGCLALLMPQCSGPVKVNGQCLLDVKPYYHYHPVATVHSS